MHVSNLCNALGLHEGVRSPAAARRPRPSEAVPHYPEYRQYTHHTNRNTFDKIVFDDVRKNSTLAAMRHTSHPKIPTDARSYPGSLFIMHRTFSDC